MAWECGASCGDTDFEYALTQCNGAACTPAQIHAPKQTPISITYGTIGESPVNDTVDVYAYGDLCEWWGTRLCTTTAGTSAGEYAVMANVTRGAIEVQGQPSPAGTEYENVILENVILSTTRRA